MWPSHFWSRLGSSCFGFFFLSTPFQFLQLRNPHDHMKSQTPSAHTLYKAHSCLLALLCGSTQPQNDWMVPTTELAGCLEHPKKVIPEEEVTGFFDPDTGGCYPELTIHKLNSMHPFLFRWWWRVRWWMRWLPDGKLCTSLGSWVFYWIESWQIGPRNYLW